MVFMDITPFVDEMAAGLRLALAAQTEPQQAENLSAAVQAPARLALMGAVSQAAAEASTTLPSGRIGVQLSGPNLVVAFEPAPADSALQQGESADNDDEQARLTLRLPSAIKARAEQAAASEGISLNNWVVRALRDATAQAGSIDFNFGPMGLRVRNRFQGWI